MFLFRITFITLFVSLASSECSAQIAAKYANGPALPPLPGAPGNLFACIIDRGANQPVVAANPNGSLKIDISGQYNYRNDCTFSKIEVWTTYVKIKAGAVLPAPPGSQKVTFQPETAIAVPPDWAAAFAQVPPAPAGYKLRVKYKIWVTKGGAAEGESFGEVDVPSPSSIDPPGGPGGGN
jgi:hypothetical protein